MPTARTSSAIASAPRARAGPPAPQGIGAQRRASGQQAGDAVVVAARRDVGARIRQISTCSTQ